MNATPPTFLPDLFETLQVFLSRFEDVHDVWLLSSDWFGPFFSILNLVIFGLKHIYSGYLVNAMCFCQGMKMCLMFG